MDRHELGGDRVRLGEVPLNIAICNIFLIQDLAENHAVSELPVLNIVIKIKIKNKVGLSRSESLFYGKNPLISVNSRVHSDYLNEEAQWSSGLCV